MVEMHFVDSKSIEAIGYDEAVNELHVRFLRGATYVYPNFPMDIYEELRNADSKGSYFSKNIRPAYTEFYQL